jgi:hypothetical protein
MTKAALHAYKGIRTKRGRVCALSHLAIHHLSELAKVAVVAAIEAGDVIHVDLQLGAELSGVDTVRHPPRPAVGQKGLATLALTPGMTSAFRESGKDVGPFGSGAFEARSK